MGRVEVNGIVKRNVDYELPYWAKTASTAATRRSVSVEKSSVFDDRAAEFHQAKYPAAPEARTAARTFDRG